MQNLEVFNYVYNNVWIVYGKNSKGLFSISTFEENKFLKFNNVLFGLS